MMQQGPFAVDVELPGWTLFWALLERRSGAEQELEKLRRDVAREARDSLQLDQLASQPVVAALRRLYRQAGTDPTRYRPSSEALIRRLLKGHEMPAIDPLVDLNNCLSAALAVPCCVMAEGKTQPPYLFRAGLEGEHYESLRGPFNLEGKPLLLDAEGPCDTPITGSQRVKVEAATKRAFLVAYMPAAVLEASFADDVLNDLLQRAGVAQVLHRFAAHSDTS